MSEDFEDLYGDLGELDEESHKDSDSNHNSPPSYILIKLQDMNSLEGIINGQAVSLPVAQREKISYIFDKNRQTLIFFMSKIGDTSINYEKYLARDRAINYNIPCITGFATVQEKTKSHGKTNIHFHVDWNYKYVKSLSSFDSKITEELASSEDIVTENELLSKIHTTFLGQIRDAEEDKSQADDLYSDFKETGADPTKLIEFSEYYKLLKTQVTNFIQKKFHGKLESESAKEDKNSEESPRIKDSKRHQADEEKSLERPISRDKRSPTPPKHNRSHHSRERRNYSRDRRSHSKDRHHRKKRDRKERYKRDDRDYDSRRLDRRHTRPRREDRTSRDDVKRRDNRSSRDRRDRRDNRRDDRREDKRDNRRDDRRDDRREDKRDDKIDNRRDDRRDDRRNKRRDDRTREENRAKLQHNDKDLNEYHRKRSGSGSKDVKMSTNNNSSYKVKETIQNNHIRKPSPEVQSPKHSSPKGSPVHKPICLPNRSSNKDEPNSASPPKQRVSVLQRFKKRSELPQN